MSIKVAIVGLGNCASSLIQAVEAAKIGKLDKGVSYDLIGTYKVSDIEFRLGFDVDKRKINKDITEAIFCQPNCTTKYLDVKNSGAKVEGGAVLDGVSEEMREFFKVDDNFKDASKEDIVTKLKASKAEIVISYLPVGSDKASEFYAEAAAEAGCAFVNCIPTNIANSDRFRNLFKSKNLPLLGDDIKSQIGSTAIHRTILNLLRKKGVNIKSTYQLNIGGNTDFKNMRSPKRAVSKKNTKEIALKGLIGESIPLGVGPSDYVPHLKDNKVGYINIEGEGLLGSNFSLEVKLKVEDSPNSASVAINAIRAAKVAMDGNETGPILDVCPYLFKNPPTDINEEEVFSKFDKFAMTI